MGHTLTPTSPPLPKTKTNVKINEGFGDLTLKNQTQDEMRLAPQDEIKTHTKLNSEWRDELEKGET